VSAEGGNVRFGVRIEAEAFSFPQFEISILEKGSAELNREEVRGVLQRFFRQMQEALQQPLWFEE
jgi:hypothetical protein